MKPLNFNSINFIKSFLNFNQINIYSGCEIALLGYSNTGKSTLINTLSNNKRISRVSKFPGSTQLINFFKINQEDYRIVDFPGYGYSSYMKFMKVSWLKEIKKYLSLRLCLIGVVLVVDIRFLFKKKDLEIINFLNKKKINFIILLNKCDQISFSLRKKRYFFVKNEISFVNVSTVVQLFSSFKKIGIEELKETLKKWYFIFYKKNN
jgi:GTP-binding protein